MSFYFYNTLSLVFQMKTNNLKTYEKKKEKYVAKGVTRNHTYHRHHLTQPLADFLICENCYWTASIFHHASDKQLNHYKKCPICKSGLNSFSIPKLYC